MTVLICPDKFKGSLTAIEVCDAVAAGLQDADPGVVLQAIPLADGGEGTCELLTRFHGGRHVEADVQGPRFGIVQARYGWWEAGNTAFIEMAEASGLTLLAEAERDPMVTSSVGTGQLIADALGRSIGKIVLGIGGSATNDAGIGMASALGYEFCDAEGKVLKPTGENLIHIRHIRSAGVHPALKDASVTTLCDVTNPLSGPDGAAWVYGPQKGATPDDIALLDAGLRNFRRVVHKQLNVSVDFPGAGAAGGLGAGARVFLNARMVKGINHIMETTGLATHISKADMIVTGEGRIDNQTFSGKVVSEVLQLAQEAGKPVVVICGRCDLPPALLKQKGLEKVITLVDSETSAHTAMTDASRLIRKKIAAAFR